MSGLVPEDLHVAYLVAYADGNEPWLERLRTVYREAGFERRAAGAPSALGDDELRSLIVETHLAGDDETRLEQLQAEYRRRSWVVRASGTRPQVIVGTRARSRAATPLRRTPRRSGPDAALRSTASPLVVLLDESARRTIMEEANEWGSDVPGEGVETGAYLFGAVARSTIDVSYAALPGERTVRRRDEVLLDSERARSTIAALERQRTGERLIGDWHLQITPSNGRPSEADVQAWAGMRSWSGAAAYLGLIIEPAACAGPERWLWPDLHAWIVREEHGALVCERAQIEGS